MRERDILGEEGGRGDGGERERRERRGMGGLVGEGRRERGGKEGHPLRAGG